MTVDRALYRQLPEPVRLDQVSTLQDTGLSWYPGRNWVGVVAAGDSLGGVDGGGCDGGGD